MFKIAPLFHPDQVEAEIEDYDDAWIEAIRLSIDDDVHGVWDEEDGKLMGIAYQGSFFD